MASLPSPAVPWSEDELERSIAVRFERQVDEGPGHLALRSRGESLTFDGLDRWANRIAWSALEARGERLEPMAVLVSRRPAAIAAILGAFKAGRICLYLDASLPRERLRSLLEDAGAGLVAGGGEALPRARSLAEELGAALVDVEGEGLASASSERPGLHVPPDTPAQITYTSGSSGVPKGVVTSHRHLLWSCRPPAGPEGIGPADRVLLAASPGAGQALGMFLTLLNGGAVFPFDIESEGLPALRDWIAGAGITVYHSVPAVFRSLVKTLREGERFPSLRLVRLGGDVVRREDVELFQRHFPQPCLLRIGYGCTEAGPIAGHVIGPATRLPDGPVPVGRPYDGVDVRLLDEEGREVGTGEVGEITVRSRYLALGYWRREELTRERFRPDPAGGPERSYRTGDLGQLLEDGLLVHRGRKDEQVKIRGNRVEVGEVEAALRALPRVEDAAVAAQPGPDGECRLVGYLVWKGPAGSTRALRSDLGRTLPAHMVPAVFVTVPGLPRNARGKLDRAALKPPAPEATAAPDGYVGPRDDVEKKLAEIWEELLRTRPVDVRHDFFELGGDSLLAIELVFLIESRLGRRIPRSTFIRASTIERIAEVLRAPPPRRWPCLVPIRSGGSRPPFFCVSWAMGEVIAYRALADRLGPDQPVYGLRRERLDDGRPRYTRVEDLAAQYVEEILEFQPAGPYRIGGLSGGAVMAFEMAQQLREAGHEVDLLVLLEPPRLQLRDGLPTACFDVKGMRSSRGLLQNARYYWAAWQLFEPEEKLPALRRRVWKLRRKLSRTSRALRRRFERAAGAGAAPPPWLPDSVLDRVEPYLPRTYPGRAVLFLAGHERINDDVLRSWGPLVTGGLETRVVPGVHEALIMEPFVRVVARQLEACLSVRPMKP